jgi:small subunit ribosomal protein S9
MARTKTTKTIKSIAKDRSKTETKPVKKADLLEGVKAETSTVEINEEKNGKMETKTVITYDDDEQASSVREKADEKQEKAGLEKYYEAVGRRKESVARVRLYTRKSTDIQVLEDKALITVEGKPYYEYFNDLRLQRIVEAPLRKLKSLNRFKATVKVYGGGVRGQADAIKLGLARSLVLFDPNFSKKLRKAGYLTRDPRAKERRKYGLKKARKAPQWAKR